MSLEDEGELRWFNRELVRKVGDGMETLFWEDAWVTSIPLIVAFPHLFQ